MSERAEIAKRIMRAMRFTDAREQLLGEDGITHDQIIVCLNTDSIGYAAGRVAAVGGQAVVVVPDRNNVLWSVKWHARKHAELLGRFDFSGPEKIGETSTLGMLLDLFEVTGYQPMTIEVSDAASAAVTKQKPLMIPA